ncbi:hypothetical protein [Endothiovibrio diazotrophicus]
MKRLSAPLPALLLAILSLLVAPTAGALDLTPVLSDLIGQASAGNPQRRISACTPYTRDIPGAQGGTATLAGQGCFTGTTSVTVSGTITYSSYGLSPGVTVNGTANGTIQLSGDLTAGSFSSVTVAMTDGPVTYTIYGGTYTVTYDNFTIEYSDALTPVSASGGVTINGVYYPATLELAGYVI